MSSYTFLEKILNEQFLGDTDLSNFLFNKLCIDSKEKVNKNKSTFKHIFITGLARSGSTALLNQLFQQEEYGSIFYKHMPFILNPKLANIFSKVTTKNKKLKPRLHNDGIQISIDSPECFDEILWKKIFKNNLDLLLSANSKIKKEKLEIYKFFIDEFCRLQGKNGLVIKNNNNHIRIEKLAKYFKDSNFIILFRNPIDHSNSLFNTHKRFCELQKEDPYITNYMNLIGHYEFGINAFNFDYGLNSPPNKIENKEDINFWLQQWINAYEWLLEYSKKKRNNVHFISYSKICNDSIYIQKMYKDLKLNFPDKYNISSRLKNEIPKKQFSRDLLKKAFNIYSKLELIE
tara:strand:+ start:130 stop:1167 length:1038 start_codon:yes stop_codon:yes gene_type:complete